jgi:Glycine zipper 2TM domain
MITATGVQPSSPVIARRWGTGLLSALVVVTLAACTAQPARETAPPGPATAPVPVQVYFYPIRNQGPAQQDRDRYECYVWARKQTGFDPSAPQLAPHQRLEVAPMPPAGHDTAVGAATGAVLGAVVSPPGRTAEGAAVGAVAGAIAGAASDAARQEQAERLQQRVDQREAQRRASLEQRAHNYRRAMTACLEARGYRVR